MKVYLVSVGSYSDYHVQCAFTTYDLATEYAAHLNGLTVEQQRQGAPDHSWTLKTGKYLAFFVEDRDLYDMIPVVPT